MQRSTITTCIAILLVAVSVSFAWSQGGQRSGGRRLDEYSQAVADELAKVKKAGGGEEEFEKLVTMSDDLIVKTESFTLRQFNVIADVTKYLFEQKEFDHAEHLCKSLQEATAELPGATGKSMRERTQASLTLVKETRVKSEHLGKPMEIAGTTVTGANFSIEDYKGNYILIDYWATWCKPCIAELPNVKATYAKYHELGFEVVGVSLDGAGERSTVAKFLSQNGISWVNLHSADRQASGWSHPLAKKYGVSAIPATFLLDRDGNVIAKGLRGQRLAAALDELFAEEARDRE